MGEGAGADQGEGTSVYTARTCSQRCRYMSCCRRWIEQRLLLGVALALSFARVYAPVFEGGRGHRRWCIVRLMTGRRSRRPLSVEIY